MPDAPADDTLLLQGSPGELARAMDWIASHVDAAGLPPRAAYGLNLSADEALTNVMLHGFVVPPGAPPVAQPQVQLRCAREQGRVVVEIRHNGPPYDPTAHVANDLTDDVDAGEPGGHGIRLMRHFLSDMRYAWRDGWNELTLVSGD